MKITFTFMHLTDATSTTTLKVIFKVIFCIKVKILGMIVMFGVKLTRNLKKTTTTKKSAFNINTFRILQLRYHKNI